MSIASTDDALGFSRSHSRKSKLCASVLDQWNEQSHVKWHSYVCTHGESFQRSDDFSMVVHSALNAS